MSSKHCAFLLTSFQSVATVANHKPKTSSEESEIASIQEEEGILASLELAAQSSKGNQAAAGMGKSLTEAQLTQCTCKALFIFPVSFDALKPL